MRDPDRDRRATILAAIRAARASRRSPKSASKLACAAVVRLESSKSDIAMSKAMGPDRGMARIRDKVAIGNSQRSAPVRRIGVAVDGIHAVQSHQRRPRAPLPSRYRPGGPVAHMVAIVSTALSLLFAAGLAARREQPIALALSRRVGRSHAVSIWAMLGRVRTAYLFVVTGIYSAMVGTVIWAGIVWIQWAFPSSFVGVDQSGSLGRGDPEYTRLTR
jgi:hypothetical protein